MKFAARSEEAIGCSAKNLILAGGIEKLNFRRSLTDKQKV
jgi:hypothetical protein